MSSNLKPKILVVESTREKAAMVAGAVRAAGFTDVTAMHDTETAYRHFCTTPHDIVLAGWEGTPVSGPRFTRQLRGVESPNFAVPVILLISLTSIQLVIEARDAGVTEFLCRPFSTKDIYVRIAHVMNNPRKFISTGQYRGPCRRRSKDGTYTGPRKRADDERG